MENKSIVTPAGLEFVMSPLLGLVPVRRPLCCGFCGDTRHRMDTCALLAQAEKNRAALDAGR